MSLTIACACGQHYSIGPEYAGQRVPCPMCGVMLTVPGAAAPAPPAAGTGDEPIVVACRACKQQYSVPRQYGGMRTPCPGCHHPLDIPLFSRTLPSRPPARSGFAGRLVALLIVILLAGGLAGAVLFIVTLSDELAGRDASAVPTPAPQVKASPVEAPPDRPRPEPEKEKETPPPPLPMPPPPAPPLRPALPPPSSTPWQGHRARIVQLAVTQDGRSVLTAAGGLEEKDGKEVAADSTLRRWDAVTGKEAERWLMSETGVGAAAFSPDGRLAAISPASEDRSGRKSDVILFDLREKRRLHLLSKHTKAVRCLAFSFDGKQVLSGGDDNLLILWDAATGKPIQEMKGHTNAPNQVVFSPDGKRALSCGMDHSARLWDLEGGRQLRDFPGHADIVWTVAFSPDGQRALTGCGMQQIPGIGLVAGGRDYEIRLWDVNTGKELKRFAGHTAAVTALAFSGDGRRFFSGSHAGRLRLWQIDRGKVERIYEGHDGRVRGVAFFSTGRRALSAGEDGRLRSWALPLDVTDLVKDLRGDSADARLAALTALIRLREDARPAVPALFEVLAGKDERLRPGALQLLRDLSPLGKEHVGRLDRLLQDQTFPEGRLFSLDALAGLGADAGPAAKSLLAAVADKDVIIRRKALQALAPVVGELGDSAFRPLLQALRDPDAKVSAAAETALGKMAAPGADQVPTLRKLLGEEGVAVRRYGLRTLGELGEAAAPAVGDVVERATKDSSAELRGLAITALVKIAPRDPQVVQAYTQALADREATVCRLAAKGLAAAGAVKPLLKALLHADAEVAKTAGEALDLAKYEKTHAPLLVELLDSKEEAIRERGIVALGKLGKEGEEGVPALIKILKTAEAAERKQVLTALGKIGKAASSAGEPLALLLKDKDRAVRFDVCRTLIRIEAPEVKKAVPVLIDALKAAKVEDLEDEDEGKEREKARDLLVQIGKPALKGLVYAMGNEFVGGRANTPMGLINGSARVEVLKVLLGMGSSANRNDVMLALTAMERGDPFPAVRKAAREVRVKLQRKE